MAWTTRLTQLNDVLADLVPFQESILRFVKAAGLKPQMIDFHGNAQNIWCHVLSEADKQNQVIDVINAVLTQYPKNPYLQAALSDIEINYSLSPDFDTITKWNPIDERALEVLTLGVDTLLPIHFLEKGLLASRPVAKIEIQTRLGFNVGTGFLFKIAALDELFFMTNHHVIHDKTMIPHTRILFNYEEDVNGHTKNSKSFKINPNGIWYTSPPQYLDVTICKLQASEEDLKEFGYLSLKKTEIQKNDFVNIIQHPGGQMKQISLYHNIVTYVEDRMIQYLTDTLGGSSGSPVFNSNWEVVALHHSGGGKRRDEVKLPMGAKSRNEGIQMNNIIDFLLSNHQNKHRIDSNER
jgi:V8-like Glu-specific endopeptidase